MRMVLAVSGADFQPQCVNFSAFLVMVTLADSDTNPING
ncbi:MAG: hypothetical protein RLZZ245_107 [Verrucomicrobiota bacterium]